MRIGVIGAGVIGVTTALELARRGHEVALFDAEGVAAGASRGNAGAFAFADIFPLASPGIMAQAPRWLADPLGPLSIPPAYVPRLLPWLCRFALASRPGAFAAGTAAQTALMRASEAALGRLTERFGLESCLRRDGQLQLYATEAGWRGAQVEAEAQRRAGIAIAPVEGAGAIAELQPGLAPDFTRALHTPGWSNVTDPALWVARLAGEAQRLGVILHTTRVAAVRPGADGVEISGPDLGARFEQLVIACGAFSVRLTRSFGLNLPLETERGYNTTLPGQGEMIRSHLTFAEHGFVVTRIGAGVRVGGAVELGGLERPANMARAQALLDRAARFLPGLDTGGGRQWMGFRPSMPDSLPVIGPAPGAPGVTLAFGHGHLGLTQSPGTAELVADLVEGRPPAVDPAPYRAERFLRKAA